MQRFSFNLHNLLHGAYNLCKVSLQKGKLTSIIFFFLQILLLLLGIMLLLLPTFKHKGVRDFVITCKLILFLFLPFYAKFSYLSMHRVYFTIARLYKGYLYNIRLCMLYPHFVGNKRVPYYRYIFEMILYSSRLQC